VVFEPSRAPRELQNGVRNKSSSAAAVFKEGKVNTNFYGGLRQKCHPLESSSPLTLAKGRITVNGWRRKLLLRPENVISQLARTVPRFLCTDVDREGTMTGANLEWFRKLRAATTHPIIAAGGIKTRREVSELEKIGMDAAVGMAVLQKPSKLTPSLCPLRTLRSLRFSV